MKIKIRIFLKDIKENTGERIVFADKIKFGDGFCFIYNNGDIDFSIPTKWIDEIDLYAKTN